MQFSTEIAKTVYETGPYLLWSTNSKILVADLSVSVHKTLTDLERGKDEMLVADLHNYSRIV